MTLTDQIKRAVELPEPHEHTSMTVYAGHQAENNRLQLLIDKLCAVITMQDDALKYTASNKYGHQALAEDGHDDAEALYVYYSELAFAYEKRARATRAEVAAILKELGK